MSQMIATRFSTRAKLLKGDLPNSGPEMTTSPLNAVMQRPPLGRSQPIESMLRQPPPGLPVPPQFGSKEGLPVNHGAGDFGKIGDVVTQLSASIVGCHRETVRRETGLENCPSSNLHQFVPQVPHSRHEFNPPSIKSNVKKGNYHQMKQNLIRQV